MKNALVILILLTSFYSSWSQSGEIAGKITDQYREGVSKATITITTSSGTSISITNNTTDIDGNYSLKPLKPGLYTLEIKHSSCLSKTIEKLSVSADKTTFIDIQLERQQVIKKQKGKKFKR